METITIEENLTTTTSFGRMAGDERRQQILQIAVKLFSEKGFRGTTTKEIALAAGVSEAMVFRHFAAKHELYAAILDFTSCLTANDWQHPETLLAEFTAQNDDYAVFYNLALKVLNDHEQKPEFMRLLLYSALEGHELAEMFFERFVIRFYQFLGSYIESRQAEGAFRQVDPRVIVRAFTGMLIHHSLNKTLWDKNLRLLQITNEEAARNFTEVLLNGIIAE